MNLLSVVIILIIIGVGLWLVNKYIPMDAKIKMILNIIIVVVVVFWLLRALGAFAYIENVRL